MDPRPLISLLHASPKPSPRKKTYRAPARPPSSTKVKPLHITRIDVERSIHPLKHTKSAKSLFRPQTPSSTKGKENTYPLSPTNAIIAPALVLPPQAPTVPPTRPVRRRSQRHRGVRLGVRGLQAQRRAAAAVASAAAAEAVERVNVRGDVRRAETWEVVGLEVVRTSLRWVRGGVDGQGWVDGDVGVEGGWVDGLIWVVLWPGGYAGLWVGLVRLRLWLCR